MSLRAARPVSARAGAPLGRWIRPVRLGRWSMLLNLRVLLVGLALFLAVVVVSIALLGFGSINIPPGQIVDVLLGRGTSRNELVIMSVRMPRLITALAVGASLGAAGAVFQSVSRNVLGSPDIIGFSTGAATGAVAQIILFGGGPFEVALAAIGGGLIASMVVYGISRRGGVSGGYRLILTGIGVGALLAALNSYLLTRGGIDQAASANIWLSGSLVGRSWGQAGMTVLCLFVLFPFLAGLGRRLSLLEMGDDAARQLGVRVEGTRVLTLIFGVGLTAAAVAAAGPISFIALAAPQLVRPMAKSAAVPIGLSALMGALLLCAADLLSQWAFGALVMPVGVVTGLIGGVYLIILLAKRV